MRFSITLLVGALATIVAAQNSFNIPKEGTYVGVAAGKPTTFTWSDKKGATVTLKLRTGDRSDLSPGTTIADKITNSGTFTWNVPGNQVEGANYAVEIINDDDTSETNYTGQFVISSKVKAVASSSSASKSASATAKSSSSGSSSSGASSTSGASSSSASKASAKTTGTASASASGTSSKASKTGASKTTSSTDTSKTTAAQPSAVPTNNSAPMVKVGGSLLAVALGFAFAL